MLRAQAEALPAALARRDLVDARRNALQAAAIWRLRERLAVLGLEASVAAKVMQRLRKMARRLAKIDQLDAHLQLLDTLDLERGGRQAATRVRNELRRRKAKGSVAARQEKNVLAARRVEKALLAAGTPAIADTTATLRDMRWAAKARVARRSAAARHAIERAGSVYVPGRLRAVQRAVRKLRFGVELQIELTGGIVDVEALARMQEGLEELELVESLIARIRRMQRGLAPTEARAFQDLDLLVLSVEHRARRLHGRYMRERGQVAGLIAKFAAKGAANGTVKQKAG